MACPTAAPSPATAKSTSSTATGCCARAAITRELAEAAELGLELPPGPNSNLSYKVTLEAGHVAFSDTSKGNPQAFFELAAFTKDVAERVCGISRE